MLRALALGPFAAMLLACHGPGRYGHAVHYAPTSAEEKAAQGAKNYDPVMVQRQPEQWAKTPVSLFGVVTARSAGPRGGAYLTLSVRRLEPRNLCAQQEDEDSCRVTVSDTEFGVVHAVVPLTDEDDTGARSVRPVSLLRLIGTVGNGVDKADGAPILRATFYRHWSPGAYVTKEAAAVMRQ